MKRLVSVILREQAKAEFEELNAIVGKQREEGLENSDEIQLLKSIRQKADILKLNPTYGDKVPHNLIPPDLDVSNLFRVGLTNHWRMLYTLDGDQVEIVAFILYIVDHPTYDKMFGYKKR